MKNKLRRKWVEALESGDYVKGTGYLCSDGSFCCLGVLADISKKKIMKKTDYRVKMVDGYLRVQNSENADDQMLPCDVLDALGLTNAEAEDLAQLNDDTKSFKKVIKAIKNKVYA